MYIRKWFCYWAAMYGTEKSEIMCTQVRSLSLYFYHIIKGDNVKMYMQMMDLEYSEKVFFSLKNWILLVVRFYRTVFSINSLKPLIANQPYGGRIKRNC